VNLPFDFELTTARCRLRVPDQKDIPHVFLATRFAGFNEGMLWDPPATEKELQATLERNLEAWRTGHAFTFTIELIDGLEFAGRITLWHPSNPGLWNMGFWLHPKHQGNGLMTEVARAIVALGFERLGAETIEACYAAWNIRSRRVLERVGMTEVEYIPQGFQKRGKWVPEYRMRIEKKNQGTLHPGGQIPAQPSRPSW
jgi:ribosomal-protein-alanine N-acetyltransferase